MGFTGTRPNVAVENTTQPLALSQCGLQTEDLLPALEPGRPLPRARNTALRANVGTDCLRFGWPTGPTAQSTSGISDQ